MRGSRRERERRETTIRLGDSAKRKKRAKVVRCRQEDDGGDITERGRKIKGKYLLPPGKYIARGGRLSECRPRSVTSFPKLIPPLPHGETNTSGRRENVNSVAPATKRKGERADSARESSSVRGWQRRNRAIITMSATGLERNTRFFFP